MTNSRIGALEAGGTKMVLGLYVNGELAEQTTLPTEAPEKTLPAMKAWFDERKIDALGIASFGPLCLDPASKDWGSITSTPKPGWRNTPLAGYLSDGGRIPCGVDTDVNAAALAEVRLGAAKGARCAVYVTIGTGVGGGIVVDGKPLHGLLHPEVGHILLQPHPKDPIPEGVCPFHRGCLEGLAAGPAFGKRAGRPGNEVPDEDPAVEIEAWYLAQMCADLLLTLSPEKILLGGGVMQRKALYPMIREKTLALLNGYIQQETLLEHPEEIITAPALFPLSGLVGAYLLGLEAAAH